MKEGTYSYSNFNFSLYLDSTSETSIGSIFRGNTFSDKPVLRNVEYDYNGDYNTSTEFKYPSSHINTATLGSIHKWNKIDNLEHNDYFLNYLRVLGNGTIKMKFNINTEPVYDYAGIYIWDPSLTEQKYSKTEYGYYPNINIGYWNDDTYDPFTEYNVKAGNWVTGFLERMCRIYSIGGTEFFEFM